MNRIVVKVAAIALIGCGVLSAPQAALAAEFLAPLPVQELDVGDRYTLGIRPSSAPARSQLSTKLELFAEGLSAGATFRRIGDEIWQFEWKTSESDRGVHVVRILVTERAAPSVVIEVEELTFIVGGVPYAVVGSKDKASAQDLAAASLSNETIVVEAATTVNAPSQGALSVNDAQENAETSVDWMNELSDIVGKPEWRLAPVASHVVTPHQWIRFPVDIISDADNIEDFVVVQIDRLPDGASFDPSPNGSRQFQWRPGTSDSGEHVFRITAVDTEDSSRRESVTMRIIVQE